MIKLLVDENFDNTIVRGLFRRNPALDMVRVQDVGLSGVDDPTILEWAAQEGRVLLTHDVATITRYAYDPPILKHKAGSNLWMHLCIRKIVKSS